MLLTVIDRAGNVGWRELGAIPLAEIDESNGIGDWDIASAYEAMTRATLVAGDKTGAREWPAKAHNACAAIADADDREVIEQDLASLDLG